MEKVVILGGGNGARTMAAEMSLADYEVSLFELPKFKSNIQKILQTKTIELKGVGREGKAKLNMVSTKEEEVGEILKGADFIMFVMPSFGHGTFARLCAEHLQKDQTIVLWPGNFGTLEIAKIYADLKEKTNIRLAEANTLPYATRQAGPQKVHLHSYATKVLLAALPSKDTTEIVAELKDFFHMLEPAANVAEVALSNPNPILHPPATILNAGRIEYSKGDFFVYREGITSSVQETVKAVHKEFMAVGEALGVEPLDYMDADFEWNESIMGLAFPTGLEKIQGPFNLDTDRYVTEDVPWGLVPVAQIGELSGVETPVTKALITLLSAINNKDYWSEGRTLKKLGIEDFDTERLKNYLNNGAN